MGPFFKFPLPSASTPTRLRVATRFGTPVEAKVALTTVLSTRELADDKVQEQRPGWKPLLCALAPYPQDGPVAS